jgi:hypothetical protein
MTIDPKAAELAKALADAVAQQQTNDYQDRAKAAEENARIDAAAEEAWRKLRDYCLFVTSKRISPNEMRAKEALRGAELLQDAGFSDRPADQWMPVRDQQAQGARNMPDPEIFEEDELTDGKPSGANGLT